LAEGGPAAAEPEGLYEDGDDDGKKGVEEQNEG